MNQHLPTGFLNSIENTEGFNKEEFEDVHHYSKPGVSIRFNIEKYKRFASPGITHPKFDLKEQVQWCEYAFYLDERPQFTLDPLLHAGAYYVQEASSMFLWEVLQQNFEPDANIKVLDLCAAPGGKTTLIASYFKNAFIVSNEVIKSRANILYENITKWGSENVVITNNDAANFQRLKNYFDLVVVDAPCSGSGLFRKDKDAIEEWSINNVQLCSQRQQRILADVHPALKTGGILIYSTCSYSPEEDEDISDWLINDLDLSSIQLQLKNEWNIVETQSPKHKAFGYRFWPHKVKGEGFFIAAFQKNKTEDHTKQNNVSLAKPTGKEISLLQKYLIKDDWIFFKHQNVFRAIHKQWEKDVALLQKSLYLKKAGVQTGEMKGNNLVPHHELALCSIINNTEINKIELTEEQALQYLRKKEVTISNAEKGWALSTYNNFPLGWIKILHNRVNNYYPTEWRILKE